MVFLLCFMFAHVLFVETTALEKPKRSFDRCILLIFYPLHPRFHKHVLSLTCLKDRVLPYIYIHIFIELALHSPLLLKLHLHGITYYSFNSTQKHLGFEFSLSLLPSSFDTHTWERRTFGCLFSKLKCFPRGNGIVINFFFVLAFLRLL